MRKSLAVFILMLLLTSQMAAAQSGEFFINSDGATLDAGQIEDAAQPLLDRGATVAVYFTDGDETELEEMLETDGLKRGDLILNSLIAILVSVEDRTSEIRYGDDWVGVLRPRAEGIRSANLDPNLREGQYTLAYVRTLNAIADVLENADVVSNSDENDYSPGPQPGAVVPVPGSSSGSSTTGIPGNNEIVVGSNPLGSFCFMGLCCLMIPFFLFSSLMRPFMGMGGGYRGGARPLFRSSGFGGRSGGSFRGSGGFGRGGSSKGRW